MRDIAADVRHDHPDWSDDQVLARARALAAEAEEEETEEDEYERLGACEEDR